MNSFTSSISLIINLYCELYEMLSSTFLELKISLLLSNGECWAFWMAMLTRLSPSP